MHTQHVVVALDLEGSGRQALRSGARLADRAAAALTVLHVDPCIGGLPRAELHQRLATVVRDVLGPGHRAALEVRTHLFPVDGILRFVEETGADLVCIGRRPRSRFGDFGLVRTARALLRDSPVPVLVAPADGAPLGASPRVLACVDLGEDSQEVVRRAATMAGARARLHLAHTVAPSAAERARALLRRAPPPVPRRAAVALRRLAREFEPWGPQSHMLVASPEVGISRLAEELRPDVVVLGTRARDRRDRLFPGGVAERAVERTRVPVLVVPAAATASVPVGAGSHPPAGHPRGRILRTKRPARPLRA